MNGLLCDLYLNIVVTIKKKPTVITHLLLFLKEKKSRNKTKKAISLMDYPQLCTQNSSPLQSLPEAF